MVAAACVVIGLVVGRVLPVAHDPQRSIAASVDASRIGQAHATVQLDTGGSGRLTVSSMPQPGAGQVYEIWVKRGSDVDPAALFDVDQNGNGHGALPEHLDGVTQVFVTRERRGGAHQPTEAPVVSARI